MTSLNRLLLAVLQIAQVALIVVVVVYAAKGSRKGVSRRVLLGSLVALVVLVAVTPLVTNAAIVEGLTRDNQMVAYGAQDVLVTPHTFEKKLERGEKHKKGERAKVGRAGVIRRVPWKHNPDWSAVEQLFNPAVPKRTGYRKHHHNSLNA